MTPEEQRQAAFAARFKNTGNLAQRQRYQETLDTYDSQRKQEGQQQYERALGAAELRDPLKAEANLLARRKENRLVGEGIAREDRFLREEQQKLQQQSLQNELAQKRFELEQNKQKIAEQRALREMEIANRVQVQSNNVEQKLFELGNSGIHEGSPEYAKHALNILLENPYVPSEMRSAVLKGARLNIDPDKFNAMKEQFKNPNVRITSTPNGDSFTITEAPPVKAPVANPEGDRIKMLTEYGKMVDIYNKDPGAKPFLEKPIQDMRARLQQFTTPAAPATPSAPTEPVAPTPMTPAAPATQAPAVIPMEFKDGKLLPRQSSQEQPISE